MNCYCCNAVLNDKGIHTSSLKDSYEIWRCHANPFVRVLPKGK